MASGMSIWSQVWRLRQEDCPECEVSVGSRVRPSEASVGYRVGWSCPRERTEGASLMTGSAWRGLGVGVRVGGVKSAFALKEGDSGF